MADPAQAKATQLRNIEQKTGASPCLSHAVFR